MITPRTLLLGTFLLWWDLRKFLMKYIECRKSVRWSACTHVDNLFHPTTAYLPTLHNLKNTFLTRILNLNKIDIKLTWCRKLLDSPRITYMHIYIYAHRSHPINKSLSKLLIDNSLLSTREAVHNLYLLKLIMCTYRIPYFVKKNMFGPMFCPWVSNTCNQVLSRKH